MKTLKEKHNSQVFCLSSCLIQIEEQQALKLRVDDLKAQYDQLSLNVDVISLLALNIFFF